MNDDSKGTLLNTQDVIADIDIRQFLAALWRNKWRIIILGMVGSIIALLLFLSQPVYYTAKTWVRIEPEITSAGESTHIDTEIKIINSWEVIAEAVDAVGVNAQVSYEGSPLMQRLSRLNHVLEQKLGDKGSEKTSALVRHAIRLDVFRVPERLQNKNFQLKVGHEGGYTLLGPDGQKLLTAETGALVELDEQSAVPVKIKVGEISAYPGAVFIIRPVSREEYIKQIIKMTDADRTGIRNSNGIIELSMKNQDAEFARRFVDIIANVYVQQALNRSARGKIKMLAGMKLRNEQVAKQLRQNVEALETFRTREKTINLSQESISKIQQLTDLQKSQTEVKAKKAEMLTSKTENHPSILALNDQISFYERQIGKIESDLDRMPEIDKNLFQLTREMELNKKIYEENAVEIGKLTNELSGLTGYAHTLGQAQVQERPYWIVALVAGILGGALTVILLVVIIFFRSTAIFSVIRNPDMLRMAAKLPVIAAIPRSRAATDAVRNKKPVTVLLDSRERAAQVLRDLEAKVKYITYGAGNNIILLTSDLENQGKSFVAANFALLSANHRRTVLVDGDIVNGKLHHNFASPGTPGFSDLIVGKATLDEVLANPIEGKLWLIPAGTSVPSHSLLHDVDKMEELMKELSKRFDLVVVDYPALVTQIDDPKLLKFAGTIFLVVRQGERAARVKRFLAKYPQGLAKVSAVILNDVTKE